MFDHGQIARQAVTAIGIVEVLKHLIEAVPDRNEKQALTDCRRQICKLQGRAPEEA